MDLAHSRVGYASIIDPVSSACGLYKSTFAYFSSSKDATTLHNEHPNANTPQSPILKHIIKHLIPFAFFCIFTAIAAAAFHGAERDCVRPGLQERNQSFTYWTALHYIFVIETTIGYGDISPCTSIGRLLTVLFSLIGVPLTFLCVINLGRCIEFLICRLHPSSSRSSSEEPAIPLFLSFILLILWLLITATYFYLTMAPQHLQWTFPTAIYFCVVTFLTIGLGDIAPEKHELVLINILFTFIGLALTGIFIHSVQRKIDSFFKRWHMK